MGRAVGVDVGNSSTIICTAKKEQDDEIVYAQ